MKKNMRSFLLTMTSAAVSLVFSAGPAIAGGVEVDNPLSGWRHQEKDDVSFSQEVHYPAVSVNTGTHKDSALLRGRIANHPKKEKPATLVVNGVAMPLLVEEGGNFARPYAFGSGSNSIEVRSLNGERKRVQFYDAKGGKTQSRLRVVLSWDSPGTDLDLHVVSPDGQHVFYGERQVANGGALDVDVTTGFGPEIFASPAPLKGTYHVYVNYYGSGENRGVTLAQVAIITNENTVHEKQQVFRVPMRRAGDLTLVKSFVY